MIMIFRYKDAIEQCNNIAIEQSNNRAIEQLKKPIKTLNL